MDVSSSICLIDNSQTLAKFAYKYGLCWQLHDFGISGREQKLLTHALKELYVVRRFEP